MLAASQLVAMPEVQHPRMATLQLSSRGKCNCITTIRLNGFAVSQVSRPCDIPIVPVDRTSMRLCSSRLSFDDRAQALASVQWIRLQPAGFNICP